MLECFLNFPDVDLEQPFLLDYAVLAAAQNQDATIQNNLATKPQEYRRLQLAINRQIVCKIIPDKPWKICIPDAMLDAIIQFYHLALNHIGMTRLRDTIGTHFHHPRLEQRIEHIVSRCDACQRYKINTKSYSHLPPRETLISPWQEVAVDLIGPFKVPLPNDRVLSLQALTIVDTVSNLAEIILVRNKTAKHVGQQFANAWLSRYPRPLRCIYDQGNEFLGEGFQAELARHGIDGVALTVKNPQSNAICERLHQTIEQALRPLIHLQAPAHDAEAIDILESAVATAQYSARAAVHGALKISPGALVFQRDMIMNIPIIADFLSIQKHRQAIVDERLLKANRSRIFHDYQPGDQVLKLTYKPDKLDPRAEGPYPIVSTHTNGTVVIRRHPFVLERINVRRIKPYRS